MVMSVDQFLSHHGVKGMKWGIRKDRRSGKTSTSSDHSAPGPHELSDDQLKAAIDRMRLEQQYHSLLHPQKPKNNSEAAAFVKELGKNLVKTAVTSAGTAAIEKAMKKGKTKPN
jgi:hypothetical protein